MQGMFQNCSSLTTIDFGDSFYTKNVKYLHYMFADCSSLTTLDLHNFNVSSVVQMVGMFDGCSSLTSLDLGDIFVPGYRSEDRRQRRRLAGNVQERNS